MKNFGLECVCLCAPMHCLCHTAMPCAKNCDGCCVTYEKPNQCYYGWPFLNASAGAQFTVNEGGKKFWLEWLFMECAEYELVEE